MATIKKRSTKKGINYDVIYDFIDFDGVRKQKSKTCKTKKEATIFKLDVETKKVKENFVSPNNILFKDYMVEWINIYSKNNWSYSHYESVAGYVKNHLNPYLGNMRMQEITPRHIESLMSALRDKPVMNGKAGGSKRNLSSTTIRSIFFVIKIAFEKAVEWGMIESTPVLCATPKKNKPKYTIWSWLMMKDALDDIEHKQLHLAVHLSFWWMGLWKIA